MKQGKKTAAMTHREVPVVPPPPDVRSRKLEWRFSTRGVAVRLFLTCWLIYGLHFATNTVREIYPALSLGDHLSFDVSEYKGLHPDIFELQGRGVFINNNPGGSIIGAVPYAIAGPFINRVVKRTERIRAESPPNQTFEFDSPYPMAREFYRQARERGYDIKFGLAAAVIQAFSMAPLSALSAVVMFYILIGLKVRMRTALLLTLLYAFATPIFYRTAQLNPNLLVSHCGLFAFALLWRPWDDPDSPQRPNYLLAGLLCGWAVVLDYSGVILPTVLGFYAVARRSTLPTQLKWRRDIWVFVAGVGVCGAVLMAYQWSSFGHPLYPAQRYMPPTLFSHYGYHGMDWPSLTLLWDTAFNMRFGLFMFAPILLTILYAPGWFNPQVRLVGKCEIRCIAVFSLAFFLFCAANQYSHMQFYNGARYIVPVVPFLFLVTAGVLLRLPKIIAFLIGILTTYWSWCLAMYRDVELGFGVFESMKHITLEGFRLPWLTTLARMGYLNGEALTLPILLLCAAVVWTLWKGGRTMNESKDSLAKLENSTSLN